jgi:hypothetical protein
MQSKVHPRAGLHQNVNVTWMPHTALSPTSQVCLVVRSAHATLDPLHHTKPQEWQTRVDVCSLGGVSVISSVFSHTSGAPVAPRKAGDVHHPSVTSATHDCVWDAYIQLPIRWRDLPRDSYLKFDVLDHTEQVVSGSTVLLQVVNELFHRLTRFLHSFLLRRCRYSACTASSGHRFKKSN